MSNDADKTGTDAIAEARAAAVARPLRRPRSAPPPPPDHPTAPPWLAGSRLVWHSDTAPMVEDAGSVPSRSVSRPETVFEAWLRIFGEGELDEQSAWTNSDGAIYHRATGGGCALITYPDDKHALLSLPPAAEV